MSTLNVSNITNGTTTVDTGYVVNGSAKAWGNWNGVGTSSIRDSLNISSTTDNGTGDYTVGLTSAMGNANYTIHAAARRSKQGGIQEGSTPTTTSYRVQYGETVDSNERDLSYNFVANFGDLA